MNKMLKRIQQSLPALATIIDTSSKTDRTSSVAILDMSYQALIVNVPKNKRDRTAFDSVYSKIVYACIKGAGANKFSNMKSGEFIKFFSRTGGSQVALINGGPDNFFLVGGSESQLRSFIKSNVSNSPSIKATRFGDEDLDVQSNSSDILVKQLNDIMHFSGGLIGAQGSRMHKIAYDALTEVNNIEGRVSFLLTSENLPPNILKSGYIELNLYTGGTGTKLLELEKKISARVLKELSLVVKSSVTESLEDEVFSDLSSRISKQLTGKSQPKRKGKTESGSSTLAIKSTKTSVNSLKPNNKPVRNTSTGKFMSLVSLQRLINEALKDRIVANMGKGRAKAVLNNRTGRFASSVHVERLTKTRDDEINAFYNYMKYPYQTFEPGFKQGSPSSRDPKKLISKSIRDVAASIVTTRLRAILV